jgi:hypothetical protein
MNVDLLFKIIVFEQLSTMQVVESVSKLVCSGDVCSCMEGIENQSRIVENVDGMIGDGLKVSDDGEDEALRQSCILF